MGVERGGQQEGEGGLETRPSAERKCPLPQGATARNNPRTRMSTLMHHYRQPSATHAKPFQCQKNAEPKEIAMKVLKAMSTSERERERECVCGPQWPCSVWFVFWWKGVKNTSCHSTFTLLYCPADDAILRQVVAAVRAVGALVPELQVRQH